MYLCQWYSQRTQNLQESHLLYILYLESDIRFSLISISVCLEYVSILVVIHMFSRPWASLCVSGIITGTGDVVWYLVVSPLPLCLVPWNKFGICACCLKVVQSATFVTGFPKLRAFASDMGVVTLIAVVLCKSCSWWITIVTQVEVASSVELYSLYRISVFLLCWN